MLSVMATIQAQPQHADALGELLQRLAVTSRGEHGCTIYRVFRSRQQRELFVTFEQWASAAAEAQHMQSAHVAEAFQAAAALLAAAPEIRHFDEL